MSGWTVFFVVLGVSYAVGQFFRLIDVIER